MYLKVNLLISSNQTTKWNKMHKSQLLIHSFYFIVLYYSLFNCCYLRLLIVIIGLINLNLQENYFKFLSLKNPESIFVKLYLTIYIYIHIYIYIYIYLCVCVCLYICVCIYAYRYYVRNIHAPWSVVTVIWLTVVSHKYRPMSRYIDYDNKTPVWVWTHRYNQYDYLSARFYYTWYSSLTT